MNENHHLTQISQGKTLDSMKCVIVLISISRNDFILNYQGNIMKGLCHKCHASNVELELDENNIPMCIKCRDPLDVDHTNP